MKSSPGILRKHLLDLIPNDHAQRRLAMVFIVNSLGNGAYTPVALLFLVRVAGWSAVKAGLAFTLAGLVAVLSSMLMGMAADRVNSRTLSIVLFGISGISVAALCVLTWVRSYALLLIILSISASASLGSRPVWGVFIAEIGGADRVRLRAQLRSLSNVALAAGAALAGLGIELNSSLSYNCLVLANALTFFVAAILLGKTPVAAIRAARPQSVTRLPALRDKHFVAVSVANIVMSWQYGVVMIALPVWIVLRTNSPHWIAGGAIAINGLFVVAFQVRASRTVEGPSGTSNALRLAGIFFLVACIALGLTSFTPEVITILVISAAVIAQSAGEVLHAAASFEIPYAATPAHAVGQYQGVFETSFSISTVSAPAVLTFFCISCGFVGWVILGVLFTACGLMSGWILDGSQPRRALLVPHHTGE
jgi:MFS family permease